MARYGILPPIVNVCYPASSSAPGTVSTRHLDIVADRGNSILSGGNNNQLNGGGQMGEQQVQVKDNYREGGGGGVIDSQMIDQLGLQQQPQQQQQQQMVLQATGSNSSSNQNDLMVYGGGVPHNMGVNSLEMMPYQQAGHVVFSQDISTNPNQMNSNSGGNS